MNIELDEVVVQDVSDDVLELAAGGAQGGGAGAGCTGTWSYRMVQSTLEFCPTHYLVLAIANS